MWLELICWRVNAKSSTALIGQVIRQMDSQQKKGFAALASRCVGKALFLIRNWLLGEMKWTRVAIKIVAFGLLDQSNRIQIKARKVR